MLQLKCQLSKQTKLGIKFKEIYQIEYFKEGLAVPKAGSRGWSPCLLTRPLIIAYDDVNGNYYDHDGDLKDGHAMMIQRASLPALASLWQKPPLFHLQPLTKCKVFFYILLLSS